MANWVQVETFRAGARVWVNLDLATTIRQGQGAFAEATQISIPGQPDLYVVESLETVAKAASAPAK